MTNKGIDIHCNTEGCSICRHINKLCPGRKGEEWELNQSFQSFYQGQLS